MYVMISARLFPARVKKYFTSIRNFILTFLTELLRFEFLQLLMHKIENVLVEVASQTVRAEKSKPAD